MLMVSFGAEANDYWRCHLDTWEKVFMDRYKGFDSYSHACEVMVSVLNAESDCRVHLNTDDLANLKARKCLPGGRFWANINAPKEKRQLANCYALSVDDTRESWAKLIHDVSLFTMYGGGLGVDYSALRPNKSPTATPGQLAGGPCSLIKAVDAVVYHLRSCRRGALLAQLNWNHADIYEFMALKQKDPAALPGTPPPLPRTNISVQYDEYWHGIIDAGPSHPGYAKAWGVFVQNVELAVTCGEPGILWNGVPGWNGRKLTNACSELRTDTPFDSCNIGGIFPLNFDMLEDVEAEVYSVAKTMIKVLLLGVRASITAIPEADKVRKDLNRLLIGVGGAFPLCEKYGHADGRTLIKSIYEACHEMAPLIAEAAGMSIPVDVTGIAPHGTLGLIAGCTGGIEPPFAAAYVKKIEKQDGRFGKPQFKVTIDSVYKELRERGIICRTAQDLSLKDRLEWQQFNQSCVHMGISSTINLPARGTTGNDTPIEELVQQLLRYHRKLVGLTFYPDGAIAGQPQTPISYEDAMKFGGDAIVEDDIEALVELTNLMCKSGVCGT